MTTRESNGDTAAGGGRTTAVGLCPDTFAGQFPILARRVVRIALSAHGTT